MSSNYNSGYVSGYHDGISGNLYRPDTGNNAFDYGYSVGYEDGVYKEKAEVKAK